MWIDTHCHIHSESYGLDPAQVIDRAQASGVAKLITVGDCADDSRRALLLAAQFPEVVRPTAGLHPHHAGDYKQELPQLRELLGSGHFVAVGECGLDSWYQHSSREDQLAALEAQLRMATEFKLPLILHVRGSKSEPDLVWDDLFKLLDQQPLPAGGVIHSFTSGQEHLNAVLSRGFVVGVNGIVTFSSNDELASLVGQIPADALVLETDAPYLTPTPKRGKINEPANLLLTAAKIATLREESLAELEKTTSRVAQRVFHL